MGNYIILYMTAITGLEVSVIKNLIIHRMKKIDFRKIEVKNIEGKKSTLDLSKELGNAIYQKTADLGELELARSIYKDGEVEITAGQAAILNRYICESFLAFVQEAVCPILDWIINPKK